MAYILAQNVILKDLLQRQVGIVDANENDALATLLVDDDTEVELGHGNQAVIILVKVQIKLLSTPSTSGRVETP